MKKIIYLSAFCLALASSLLWGSAQAQNIGSLKDVVTSGFAFTMDLKSGYTDQDVIELQRVLNADVDTTVSLDGEGSRGKETKYFGAKTKAAVIKFQEKYRDTVLAPSGLSQGNGEVNKATRTKLNLLIGVMTTNNSVGSPENQTTTTVVNTTTTVVTPPATVVATTPVQSSITSICSFIDLLNTAGVISANSATAVRGYFNCSSASNLTPRVDIKVNGKDGTVTVSSARNVTITWTSSNVTSCQRAGATKSTSGSTSYYVDRTGTVDISCTGPYGTVSDSVIVRLGTVDEESDLSVTCSASPAVINIASSTVWTATVNGGDGSYTYSWSGDFSSTTKTVTKTYTTAGTKTANIKVTSDGLTATNSCSVVVSSTNVNPNNYNQFLNFNGVVSTTTGPAYVLVNGSSTQKVAETEIYQLTYDTAGLTCTATTTGLSASTTAASKWSGVLTPRANSLFEQGDTQNFADVDYSTVVLYGPDGALIEKGVVSEGDTQARFKKKGQEYPDGSYVVIKGAAKCYIPDTNDGSLKTCLPLPDKKVVYRMSCALPTNSSDASTFYTSKISNPDLDSIKWPVVKEAKLTITSTNSVYPFTEFWWKKESEKDGKLTVVYSSNPEEAAPEESATRIPFGGVVTAVDSCDPINSSEHTLWQVALAPCKAGDIVSGGSSAGGYIVIREGVQPIPKVGDSLLGNAIRDGGAQCTNAGANGANYIGVVTGALGIDSGGACQKAAAASGKDDKGNSLWEDIISGSVGNPLFPVQGGIGGAIKHVFDW